MTINNYKMDRFTKEIFKERVFTPEGINKEFLRKWINIECIYPSIFYMYGDLPLHTPLQWATEEGYLDIVKFAVKNGANVAAANNLAVRTAIICSYPSIVKCLAENGADMTLANNRLLQVAINSGCVDMVKYLLSTHIYNENIIHIHEIANMSKYVFSIIQSLNLGSEDIHYYIDSEKDDTTIKDLLINYKQFSYNHM